jgi:hypothetical protein
VDTDNVSINKVLKTNLLKQLLNTLDTSHILLPFLTTLKKKIKTRFILFQCYNHTKRHMVLAPLK